MPKIVSKLLIPVSALAVFLLFCELAVRLLGFGVWNSAPDPITVVPGGSVFQPDPVTGFRHYPGRYDVSIGDLSFVMTHNEDSLRITSPENTLGRDAIPELWFMGGSFTHGWAVSDEETFPWQIQSRYPSSEIVNFGVGGFGTLLSLLQLEQNLKSETKPEAVVVFYIYFHDQRNIFSRERRKTITGLNHLGPLAQPKALMSPDGTIQQINLNDVSYTGLPGNKRSALINLFDDAINRIERIWLKESVVTLALFERMAELTRDQGIQLVVAGLSTDGGTQSMLSQLQDLGINTIDIGHEFWEPRYNNLPWDSHPNPMAQTMYADKLERGLLELGILPSAEN